MNRALARWLIPGFIRGGVSANTITGVALMCGILGGWCLSRGTPGGMIGGAMGFLLANLLDECDGAVARQTGTVSRVGAVLDTMTDSIVHIALFVGLGIGVSQGNPHGPWLPLSVIASCGSLLAMGLDLGRDLAPLASPPLATAAVRRARWLQSLRVDFSLLVLVSAILHRMSWILWAGAVGVFAVWIPSTVLLATQARRAMGSSR